MKGSILERNGTKGRKGHFTSHALTVVVCVLNSGQILILQLKYVKM